MNIFRALLTLAVLSGAAANAETFKIATISPDGSAGMKLLREGAQEVETATEGRVAFKFYPGGVMGDDWVVLRKIRVGQLQGGIVTTSVFNQLYSDIQLYNLPMRFRSLDEVDYVREKLDADLLAGLEDVGFVTFGLAEIGLAYAMSTKSTTSVHQAGRLKVWTPEKDVAALRMIAAFNISPIPLSIADVLAGLQTGLIDTVATPPVAAIALQWHTQLEYVLDLPLMYVYGLFVVSERRFKRVSEADQAVVRRIMGDAVRRIDERNRADHDATFNVLLNQGVKLLSPSVEEVAEWQGYADTAAASWVEDGIVSKEMYQRLQMELDGLRSLGRTDADTHGINSSRRRPVMLLEGSTVVR